MPLHPRLQAGITTLLLQVHKFSKFIHGTATLLPDMIAAVPYWIDDESVRPSMLQSAGYRDAHQAEYGACPYLFCLPPSCLDRLSLSPVHDFCPISSPAMMLQQLPSSVVMSQMQDIILRYPHWSLVVAVLSLH